MHDAGSGRMARREIAPVKYADREPSALASMLGALIAANVESHPDKRRDFESLTARVGVFVTDIDAGVTLDFQHGSLTVHNGLQSKRDITIRAEADTIMSLSNLKIGRFGMPVYYDGVGRGVALQLVRGKLRIEGLLGNLATLNTVTRIFSVR